LGIINKKEGDYTKAIDYYSKCLKIGEELDDQKTVSTSLNNIGSIYYNLGDYQKALEFFSKCLKIQSQIDNKYLIENSLANIGAIHQTLENYDLAIDYYTQSLEIAKEIDDKEGIAVAIGNIGTIFGKQGNYNKALNNYNQCLDIYIETKNKSGQARNLAYIGMIYQEQGKTKKALDYSFRSLAFAQEIGSPDLIKEAASNLWKINKHIGHHKESLEMYELFISMQDSIDSEENQKAAIRQEYKYTYEKQAAADSIKTAEANKVKDAQLTAEIAKNKQQQQQKYFLYGGLTLALVFGGFIFNRFRITKKQKLVIEEQKQEVEQQKEVVEEAHHELEEKNQEIMDSITYAKRIQSAILPPEKIVKEYLQESFILYKPKDIVAGDFYWMESVAPTSNTKEPFVLFAAADCTGHGVPGAMVSVVCNNALNRSVREYGLTDPGQILNKTRDIVIQEFEKSEEDVKDGMDIALCSLEGMKLQYAGAHNPLWIIRNGKIIETKANKQPIGQFDNPEPYTTHTFDLEQGDSIYVFSDGYVDQFGGEKGKKFKARAFRELLLSTQDKSMEKQKIIIDETFENWRGSLEQIDDVCVIGVRV